MTRARELAELFRRDLTRLVQELQAFPDSDTLWRNLPGVTNSAGNLAIHLEGNLREYIGRQLGGVDYQRDRPHEFTASGLALEDLVPRIAGIRDLVPQVVAALTDGQLGADYPERVLGESLSVTQFLIHLNGHLNYHLGQIDYLRRILTQGAAVHFAGLSPDPDKQTAQ